jgi:hypothetical protein
LSLLRELGRATTTFNSVVVDLEGRVLVLVLRAGSVNTKSLGRRAESRAVFALSNVNGGGVVGVAAGVDLYVRVRGSSVFRGRSRCRSVFFVLVDALFEMATGTAVTFFFTRNMDLFFAVATLFARRAFNGCGDRRVLTFPSGLWLWRRDHNLFFFNLDGLGMGVAVPICRWEHAEGDGDAGLKVQVDDFCWRERIFSYNLPKFERKTRRILWLLFLETKVGREGEKIEG